jgi:hypothetical protein
MNRASSSKASAPRDADLERTRRQFLLAREQLAAQGSLERYFAARAVRDTTLLRGHRPDR